jgi:HTH-type transcriptional regulator/antitoxin HigA
MGKEKDFNKSLISPPGDTLKEHLDFIGMKPGELAIKMNVSQEKMQDLICGRIAVTAETAGKLEHVINIPSSFWKNREKEYRQELQKNRENKQA